MASVFNEYALKSQYDTSIYIQVPYWITSFAPADALIFQEEAWNASPKCKSVIKCPYFEKLLLMIETVHVADSGQSENVHGLTKEQLELREVDVIDIASATRDYWSYLVQLKGLALFSSPTDLEDRSDALSHMISMANSLKGTSVCAVKAHGFGENRKASLLDIAALTGAEGSTELPIVWLTKCGIKKIMVEINPTDKIQVLHLLCSEDDDILSEMCCIVVRQID